MRPASVLRRRWLQAATLAGLALPAATWSGSAAAASARSGTGPGPGEPLRLALAWRGPRADDPQQVSIFEADLDGSGLKERSRLALPGRAHGLQPLPDGGVVVAANRGGGWWLRLDADGRPAAWLRLDADSGWVSAGHVRASADGRWIHAAVTRVDPRGRVGEGGWRVLDAARLRVEHGFATGGVEPHDLVLLDDNRALLAHGGIWRDRDDRKRELEGMASSLQCLDLASGTVRATWTLPDRRLSLRHLALLDRGAAVPRVAVALQAEHADPVRRQAAPALAIWQGGEGGQAAGWVEDAGDGSALGFVGDVSAVPGQGWVLSHAERGEAWWRGVDRPGLQTLARLPQVGALATVAGGGQEAGTVLMAAARGLAWWRPQAGAGMMPWPEPMAIDNHMAVLPPRP